jgi:hypothetical protein
MNRWLASLWISVALLPTTRLGADVRLARVPENGLQPDARTDSSGRVHLIYLAGDPKAADIHYVTRPNADAPWSKPLRVNSQPGTAIAIGTVRGARLSLGSGNRVHVVWNGSSKAEPKPAESAPLLYARLNDAGTAFEPQRNLMADLRHLDGGAAVASNGRGTVLVAWHAAPVKTGAGADNETERGVYVAASADDGATFAAPRRIDSPALGVCACCALEASFTDANHVSVIYRSAEGSSERGMVELASTDAGWTFASRRLDRWTLNECPMTTARIVPKSNGALAVWQTRGTIQLRRLDGQSSEAITVSPKGVKANHPVVVPATNGSTLTVWTEGTGWKKGGGLAWQMLDAALKPQGEIVRAPDVPVWGYATAWAERDGGFTVLY